MKFVFIKRAVSFAVALLFPFLGFCEEEVPCMVFSGTKGEAINIDLSAFNRISFYDDEISVSNHGAIEPEEIVIPLSDYYHVEFKNAVPNRGAVEVKAVLADTSNSIFYDSNRKTICSQSTDGTEYALLIYTLDGKVISSGMLSDERPYSVGNLSKGLYIAIADDAQMRHILRFIIN